MKPARMESAPSDGPTVRSSRYLMEAGSDPERRTRARSEACCKVKVPGMRPAASMRLWVSATDWMGAAGAAAGDGRGRADVSPRRPPRLCPAGPGGLPHQHGIGRGNPAGLGQGVGFARVGGGFNEFDFEQ